MEEYEEEYQAYKNIATRRMRRKRIRLHIVEQNDDYKLVLGTICPYRMTQRGPDCSPSKEYLCFILTDEMSLEAQVSPTCDQGSSTVPPSSYTKGVVNEPCRASELLALPK